MTDCYATRTQKIGEILFDRGLLSDEQIAVIMSSQKKSHSLFGKISVAKGFLKEKDLLLVLAELYHSPMVDMEFLFIKDETLHSLEVELAQSCVAVPFFMDNQRVKIAIADPGDVRAIDKLRSAFRNRSVAFYIAKESEILKFIEIMKYNRDSTQKDPLLLLNKIIFDAIESNASDIHFEPSENLIVRVRFRIDGVLHIVQTLDFEPWKRIQAKLKLITNLNISENRRPQSGHTRIYLAGRMVDLRISTHPDVNGENFAVRIFDLSSGVKPLRQLAFSSADLLWLKKIISFPSGIFIIAGPTGSGKTTTLYSLLQEINTPLLNIMTLEDPVEYQIEGIKQLELSEDGLLSFSDGVRSVLRQDPDIMLIGEIRDEETAATAVRASLTGRLVLTTLHAATPLEGLRRLMDLGLKMSDFLPSLIGIFSQRLVRYRIKKSKNGGAQYHDRFPLTEYIYFSDELKKKLLTDEDLAQCPVDKTFHSSAMDAIRHKLTDPEEIKRVFGDGCIQI
jgi:type IV pilus assembly protein PilB